MKECSGKRGCRWETLQWSYFSQFVRRWKREGKRKTVVGMKSKKDTDATFHVFRDVGGACGSEI